MLYPIMNQTGYSPGLLNSSELSSQPSQTALLMAAADMQQTGKLPKGKFPSPTKPHPQGKKLKVIK